MYRYIIVTGIHNVTVSVYGTTIQPLITIKTVTSNVLIMATANPFNLYATL